jgi:Bacteriocin-protection, YdeI or OmpD-Associated/Domain of unknown function (DUF1905)
VRFEAELGLRGASGIEVPFDVREVFGAGRVPIRGTIDGAPFRTTIVRMRGSWCFPVNRELREAAGVEMGQRVTIELERDDEPRTVDLPNDLAAALDDQTRAFFDSVSYTSRKEYIRWIEDAKREETRVRRVAKAVELLRAGVREPR